MSAPSSPSAPPDGFAAVFGARRTGSGLPERPSDELLHHAVSEEAEGVRREEWRLCKGGVLHREQGPAVRVTDEQADTVTEEWYVSGELHRADGPARTCERPDGHGFEEVWYRHGKGHRDDGPAYIEQNGDGLLYQTWLQDGQPHRDDGPAILITHDEEDFRHEDWCQHGKRHREDGPAVVVTQGGRQQTVAYYANGLLHRDGGYAQLSYDDEKRCWTREWCRHGLSHRSDGPARELVFDDGRCIREWWQTGRRHRSDGPAIIDLAADGSLTHIEMWSEGERREPSDEQWTADRASAPEASIGSRAPSRLQSCDGARPRTHHGPRGIRRLLRRLWQ